MGMDVTILKYRLAEIAHNTKLPDESVENFPCGSMLLHPVIHLMAWISTFELKSTM